MQLLGFTVSANLLFVATLWQVPSRGTRPSREQWVAVAATLLAGVYLAVGVLVKLY